MIYRKPILETNFMKYIILKSVVKWLNHKLICMKLGLVKGSLPLLRLLKTLS